MDGCLLFWLAVIAIFLYTILYEFWQFIHRPNVVERIVNGALAVLGGIGICCGFIILLVVIGEIAGPPGRYEEPDDYYY